MNYYSRKTLFGVITITEEGGYVTSLFWGEGKLCGNNFLSETLAHAFTQLEEYFSGRRKEFDLLLQPEGTEFQSRVWNAIREIEYGKTISYKYIAEKIGNKKACRAVGMACGRNKIAIFIPCHRVIGSDCKIGGYAYGIKNKELLLSLEKRNL